MLNVIASIIVSTITLILKAAYAVKGPLVIGAIVAGIILAFPATSYAAVIQCNVSDCSMITTSFPESRSLIPWTKNAAFVLFFGGLITGNFLMWHDRKVTAERIKAEEKEWLKKYHS